MMVLRRLSGKPFWALWESARLHGQELPVVGKLEVLRAQLQVQEAGGLCLSVGTKGDLEARFLYKLPIISLPS